MNFRSTSRYTFKKISLLTFLASHTVEKTRCGLEQTVRGGGQAQTKLPKTSLRAVELTLKSHSSKFVSLAACCAQNDSRHIRNEKARVGIRSPSSGEIYAELNGEVSGEVPPKSNLLVELNGEVREMPRQNL